MLGEKILPTGIGHTTNCFLQVEGGDMSQEDACIYTPGSDTPQNVKVRLKFQNIILININNRGILLILESCSIRQCSFRRTVGFEFSCACYLAKRKVSFAKRRRRFCR